MIALVHQLEKGLIYSTEEINLLRTKIALMNQRTYGRKTESHPHPNQGDLFAQSESQTLNGSVATDDVNQTTPCVSVAVADSESQSTQALVSTHKSKPVKIKPARKQLPDALPREERVIDLEDKSCRHCQSEMTFIGDAISEKLNYIPAVINVIRTVRKKYACQCCECI